MASAKAFPTFGESQTGGEFFGRYSYRRFTFPLTALAGDLHIYFSLFLQIVFQPLFLVHDTSHNP